MAAEERDDLDVAWARIVADYDREIEPQVGRWPAQEDLDDSPPDTCTAPDTEPAAMPETALDAPALGVHDEHHFVPPEPPPLGPPDLPTGMAWGGLLGGPLLLLFSTLLAWQLPSLLTAACILGFVGGMVFLIARLGDGSDRDGWDDGAQV